VGPSDIANFKIKTDGSERVLSPGSITSSMIVEFEPSDFTVSGNLGAIQGSSGITVGFAEVTIPVESNPGFVDLFFKRSDGFIFEARSVYPDVIYTLTFKTFDSVKLSQSLGRNITFQADFAAKSNVTLIHLRTAEFRAQSRGKPVDLILRDEFELQTIGISLIRSRK
jgi:hypothetical protein